MARAARLDAMAGDWAGATYSLGMIAGAWLASREEDVAGWEKTGISNEVHFLRRESWRWRATGGE
jgi:hypothetical protein